MSAVNKFRKLIANKHVSEGLSISQWPGTTRRSNHLLEISTKKKSTVIYVKESNLPIGFWGLTKNQLDRLDKSRVCWFAVLLLRSNNSGYVLSSSEVNDRINNKTFRLATDGEYKVNEGTDLTSGMAFQDLKDLLARIF